MFVSSSMSLILLLVLCGVLSLVTSQSVCVYDPDPEYFNCQQSGTFENHNDLSCSSFYACYQNTVDYWKVLKTCVAGTYYNPNISACDWYYTCPCTESNKCYYVTDPNYFTCEESGNFENLNDLECTTYFTCYRTATGFHKTLRRCNKGTYFNPDKKLCDWYYARPCTTDTECNYNADPDYFNCTQSGYFTNDNDLDCSSYYSCVLSTSGYVRTLEKCPLGAAFNPRISICDPYYTCPCTTVAESFSVQKVMLDDDQCTVKPGIRFECSAELGTGCFADPGDPFCESFIYCYVSKSGLVYEAVRRTCPTGNYFNSSSTSCDCSDYECPCIKS